MLTRSPLAPDAFPEIPEIAGLRFATAEAGERYRSRLDLMLAVVDAGSTAAGVFTRSTTPGAPVQWSKGVLKAGGARAVVVNAGNANVCTGEEGMQVTAQMAAAAAASFGGEADQVFVCSTGVIGEPLKVEKVLAAMPGRAALSEQASMEEMASAIMTTDTFPKGATQQCDIAGVPVRLAGVAKGSGMIAPNMATMLSFLYTDAHISAECLQALLSDAVQRSFNCITVDSDTSTSDTCLLFATGKAGNAEIVDAQAPELAGFREALGALALDLAQQVVRDGEGARKLITVRVAGAQSEESAHRIAMSVANSPLVKTAVAGEDANWGRVIMAVGKCGEPIDLDNLRISMGGVAIAKGNRALFDYDESEVAEHLKGQEIDIEVDVGLGTDYRARVWTCDLTHAYIDINADYRS